MFNNKCLLTNTLNIFMETSICNRFYHSSVFRQLKVLKSSIYLQCISLLPGTDSLRRCLWQLMSSKIPSLCIPPLAWLSHSISSLSPQSKGDPLWLAPGKLCSREPELKPLRSTVVLCQLSQR